MHYEGIQRAVFVARPNRFIAHVELEGTPVICHVKNTGRCRELLIAGATVYVQRCDNPARKTGYDLIAVEKKILRCAQNDMGEGAGNDTGEGAACHSEAQSDEASCHRLINMDAQAPNRVFGAWAAAGAFVPGLTLLRPETTWGNSRFDFYWEAGDRRGFVEVKGVTLETDGAAYFPDAPTQRGVKHAEELMRCRAEGWEACLFFVIQMEGVAFFAPNDATHPAFGAAVRRAAAAGVEILAHDCAVTPDSLVLRAPVEVRL